MATIKKDVIVVGGGIFGLSCAYACAKRSLSVVLVDAGRVAGAASGGVVGAMSPHVPERWIPKKQFQLEALLSAADHWREIEAISGLRSGYGRVGRLMPIPTEEWLELSKFRSRGAQELWQRHAEWRVEQAGYEGAWLDPEFAKYGVAFDTVSARINPREACAALAGAAKKRGVEIRENWRVDEIGEGSVSGVLGNMQATTIIIAAGVPGFDLLEPILGRAVGKGVKGQSALFDVKMAATTPTIFFDGLYIVPHVSGGVAVGSTSENTWDDPNGTDERLDDIIKRVRTICPVLRQAPVQERWAALRPKARCRDPMLGPVPGMETVFAAMGAFKIGFGITHKVGEILADLAQRKPTDIPPSFTVQNHMTGK